MEAVAFNDADPFGGERAAEADAIGRHEPARRASDAATRVGSGATATERERALEDVMSARLSWLSAKDSAGLPALPTPPSGCTTGGCVSIAAAAEPPCASGSGRAPEPGQ